ncbi:Ig-like domain repeat protein [Methanosphaera sp. ISO3-F5]|uniref:beta strand repeat-containing protein n=1 Tax=Methanosphaera sp. ISO3-F5 TaxID=1452353 RepID=UPI002B257665|nr:Ig-like domain repeat protein [Methanosphaera sp. ISO3-F5]WQH64222.1 Ig-like domain repeat protein [Methanosphaera sp. ISO3-F5]
MKIKGKYFIIFLFLIITLISTTVAADTDNITQTTTTIENTPTTETQTITENEKIQTYDNNYEDEKKIIKTKNNIKTASSSIDITEENFNEYFTKTNNNYGINETKIEENKDNIYNIKYLPENAEVITITTNNNKYENTTLTLNGAGKQLKNTAIRIDNTFKNITIENLEIIYNDTYNSSDFIIITNPTKYCTLQNLNITANRSDSSSKGYILDIRTPGTIENLNINTNFVETNQDNNPEGTKRPNYVPVNIESDNILFKNNELTLNNWMESYSLKTSLGIYSNGNNNTFINNHITLNAHEYAYALRIYGDNNIVSDNEIEVYSETYANGVGIESASNNNTIKNNRIHVVAGDDFSPFNNAQVVYAIMATEYTYHGSNYTAKANSPSNNKIINNTLTGQARQFYGYEQFGGVNTLIENNTIECVEANSPEGIGVIGENITIKNNKINLIGKSSDWDPTVDYVKSINSGIYTSYSSKGIKILGNTINIGKGRGILVQSSNVKIEDNTVFTDNYDYAIEISKKNTILYQNNLYSDLGSGLDTVNGTYNLVKIVTPETFSEYITDGLLNDDVNNGETLDFRGKFDGEQYSFTINKPVNIISSTGDAFFSFFSTPKAEGTSELPDNSFIITGEGSGSNITGIQFENTMIVTNEAHNVTFDNITSICNSGYGWGRGSTSIRNSENITIKNSYFNTSDNNGVSSVVFAASQNCVLENSTVVGSGFVGNLVYATTYNIDVDTDYGNNNITIRNNKIIARNLEQGIATCYSVCLTGTNITVENNYIENNNGYLINTQYREAGYDVKGKEGSLNIVNNSFAPGRILLTFNPCTIANNTFYGNVTLIVTNETIQQNNTIKDENENPYLEEEEKTIHPTNVVVNAPTSYTYDESNTFTVTVTDLKTGQKISRGYLEVYADGYHYKNITINSESTTFVYANPTHGTHRVRVWFYPEDTNTLEQSQKLHTIVSKKIEGQLKVEAKNNPEIGETITLKATYTLNKNLPHKANITFELPGQKPITLTAVNNTATLETTITTDYIRNILGGREQNIKITAITDNPNIEITEISTKLGVKQATTSIEITPTQSKIGQATTITATVKTPNNTTINTGTITFTDKNGKTIATSNVNNNKATTIITFNNVGSETITATYTGTVHFKNSDKTSTITVTKLDTKITSTASTAKYGEKTTITGKLADENNKAITNADITITINGVQNKVTTNNNGEYTLTTNINKVGQNTATITYNGNTNYNPTSTTTTINVNKQDTIVTINSIPARKYNESVTITGTLKDKNGKTIANANIKLNINNKETTVTTNNIGTYTYTTQADTTGTNNIIISFVGNTNYNSANTQTTFIVTKDTKITINTKNVKYEETITITGKLADENNKAISNTDITLTLNNNKHNIKTNNNGEYTYTTTATTIGTNNVTVTYNGNSNYNPTSTTTTITINKQDTLVTTNTIPATKYTESVTITGTLKDKNGKTLANQNIKLNINGNTVTVKTDKNGAFSYKHTTNTVGTNNLTVTFAGNNNYNNGNTQTTFTVNKQDTTITLNNIKSTYTSNTTITGKLTTNDGKILANQNIKLNINGKTTTIKTDKNGIITYKYQTNKVGTNNITITYNGNTNYQGTTLKKTFTVSKLDLKITINKITTVAYGEKIIIKGTFKDKNGKILGNSKLKLNINGKTTTIKTDKNGIFTYKHTTQKVGTNNITISHQGTKNYNKITKKTTFKVTKQNLKITLNRTNKVGYGSKVYVKGQLTDKHSKIIRNTVITININGKIIRAKTNSKGIYNHSLTTTKLGSNTITVTYPGNKNYNKITKKTTFTVTKQTVKITTNTKQVKGSKKVTVTGKLTTKDGKALRNSKVTLTINGKKKTAKTNTKGAYTLTVTAKTGKNTLIASFTGNKYYNKYTGAKKVFSIA